MANTQRSPSNLPPLLDTLVNLTEVDLSRNKLTKIPDCLFTVPNLKRLNISDNNIAGELNVAIGTRPREGVGSDGDLEKDEIGVCEK